MRFSPPPAQHQDQATRRALYLQVQQILSDDEPTVVLWSLDNVVVHSRRLHGVRPVSSGTFDWLRTATLDPRPAPLTPCTVFRTL